MSPEEARQFLLPRLSKRHQNHPEHFTPLEGLDYQAAYLAVENDPESILKLAYLEARGGEPMVVDENEDYYFFADSIKEAPRNSWVPYFDALETAEYFGFELTDENIYRGLQLRGEFDNDRNCWIKTEPDASGKVAWAKQGTRKKVYEPTEKSVLEIKLALNGQDSNGHFRGMVKVPKKKNNAEKTRLPEAILDLETLQDLEFNSAQDLVNFLIANYGIPRGWLKISPRRALGTGFVRGMVSLSLPDISSAEIATDEKGANMDKPGSWTLGSLGIAYLIHGTSEAENATGNVRVNLERFRDDEKPSIREFVARAEEIYNDKVRRLTH